MCGNGRPTHLCPIRVLRSTRMTPIPRRPLAARRSYAEDAGPPTHALFATRGGTSTLLTGTIYSPDSVLALCKVDHGRPVTGFGRLPANPVPYLERCARWLGDCAP